MTSVQTDVTYTLEDGVEEVVVSTRRGTVDIFIPKKANGTIVAIRKGTPENCVNLIGKISDSKGHRHEFFLFGHGEQKDIYIRSSGKDWSLEG